HRGMQRVSKYLICRTGWRGKFFVSSFRQLNVGQQRCYLLPCIRIIDVIFKHKRNDRKPEHRLGTKIDLSLNAVHCNFNRDGNKALDFLCTSAWPACDDAYLCIGKIRKGYDRCFDKTKYPDDGKRPRHKKSKQFMTQRKSDNIFYEFVHKPGIRIKGEFLRKLPRLIISSKQ